MQRTTKFQAYTAAALWIFCALPLAVFAGFGAHGIVTIDPAQLAPAIVPATALFLIGAVACLTCAACCVDLGRKARR